MANDEQLRGFEGIWIPRAIWLNENLTPYEKIFVAEINSLDNDEEKGCLASNEYFCNFFQIKERRVQEILSSLKEKGLIFQCFFDGRTRGLRTIFSIYLQDEKIKREVRKNAPERCGKPQGRGAENCTPEMRKTAPLLYKEDNKDYNKDYTTSTSSKKNEKNEPDWLKQEKKEKDLKPYEIPKKLTPEETREALKTLETGWQDEALKETFLRAIHPLKINGRNFDPRKVLRKYHEILEDMLEAWKLKGGEARKIEESKTHFRNLLKKKIEINQDAFTNSLY